MVQPGEGGTATARLVIKVREELLENDDSIFVLWSYQACVHIPVDSLTTVRIWGGEHSNSRH